MSLSFISLSEWYVRVSHCSCKPIFTRRTARWQAAPANHLHRRDVDDVDGVFGTRVLVYHIQLERLSAIVEGRPGHGNGKKVAEVQASMSRLHAASLFRRKTRICQSFGTMPFFILEISARWNLLCTVISKMKFPRWICILYHCAPMGLPSNFMATTHCCRCHRTCTAKKKTACW